jgi:hypothetical protein
MSEKLIDDFVEAGIIFMVTVTLFIHFDIQPYASKPFELGIIVLVVSIIYVMIQRQILNAIEDALL